MQPPRAQSDGIKSVDLKSPNELTEEERVAASRSRANLCILRHCRWPRVDTARAPRHRADDVASMASCLLNIATTARRYNSYSGAAIGGTLLMLIPVAYYDGLLFEFAKSFAISALLGGGLGAYLSLRKDGVGEKAGEFGSAVVNKVKEI